MVINCVERGNPVSNSRQANRPYLSEYAGYFWRRRNKKDGKLLPALSARAFRAMMTA
jgi:hypothetical protein